MTLLDQIFELRLKKDFSPSGNIPQAVLFSAPRGSGKLTSAYHIASALGGGVEGAGYFLLKRDLTEDISFCLSVVERLREGVKIELLEHLRALMEITYNSNLVEGGKLGDSHVNFLELCSILSNYSPAQIDKVISLSKAILESFKKNSKPTKTISMQSLRDAVENLSLSLRNGAVRTLVIERIEDNSNYKNISNSLLKILEEPPASSLIILLSENPSRILPTILSRVRTYRFPAVGRDKIAEFLNLYDLPSSYLNEKDLRSITRKVLYGDELAVVKGVAAQFFNYINLTCFRAKNVGFNRNDFYSSYQKIVEMSRKQTSFNPFVSFLEETSRLLEESFLTNPQTTTNLALYKKLQFELAKAANDFEIYSLSPVSLMERFL